MSDTPRTDEAQFGTGRVSVGFACQLERELNAANESFRKLNIHALNLAARIKRLEEDLGDAYAEMRKQWPVITAVYDRSVWVKAKEAKP